MKNREIKSFIVLLGTSRLSLGCISVAMLENTEEYILIITTSEEYKTVNRVEIKNDPSLNYPVLYVDRAISDVAMLMNVLHDREIRVAIINEKHPVFSELLHYKEHTTWYSACRAGLYHYLACMMQDTTSPKHIISFDNDDGIAAKAKDICTGSNISISKAVAHCVCTSMQLDGTKEAIIVDVYDGECLIVFPPEAAYIQTILTKAPHMLSRRARLYFTNTSEEFIYWIMSKKIDVNAMHTLLCVMAYMRGYKKGMTFDEVAACCFKNIILINEVFPTIQKVHKTLYERYLSASAEEYGDNLELHTYRMEDFIRWLYSSEIEMVGRGIDPNSNNYKEKLEDHIPLLETSEDVEVIKLLKSFERLLQ